MPVLRSVAPHEQEEITGKPKEILRAQSQKKPTFAECAKMEHPPRASGERNRIRSPMRSPPKAISLAQSIYATGNSRTTPDAMGQARSGRHSSCLPCGYCAALAPPACASSSCSYSWISCLPPQSYFGLAISVSARPLRCLDQATSRHAGMEYCFVCTCNSRP